MKKDIKSTINTCTKEINELTTMKLTLEKSEYVVKKHRIMDLIDDCLESLDERIVRLNNELKSLEN